MKSSKGLGGGGKEEERERETEDSEPEIKNGQISHRVNQRPQFCVS